MESSSSDDSSSGKRLKEEQEEEGKGIRNVVLMSFAAYLSKSGR